MKTETDILVLLEDKSFQIQNLCRICLKDNMEMKYSIFESESDGDLLCGNITQLTGVVLEPQDRGLPSYMCGECHELLSLANRFRIKCRYSDELLRKVLFENNKSTLEQILNLKKEPVENGRIVDEEKNEETKEDSSMETDDSGLMNKSTFKRKRRRHIIIKQISISPSEGKGVSLENIRQIYENFDCEDNNRSQVLSENIQVRNLKDLLDICCKVCKKLLPSKRALQKHNENYHDSPRTNIITEYRLSAQEHAQNNISLAKSKALVCFKVTGSGKDRRFLCKSCSYVTKWKQNVIGHSRIHTGEKPYNCRDCRMCFSTSAGLSSHKLVHSNVKKHMCPQCGKLFRKKSRVDSHMLIHAEEKKFQCDKCNKLYKTKISLQMHVMRHDNVKNYRCESCGSAFFTITELKNHVRIHSSEKQFQCTLCDMKFRAKISLDNHLLRHRGNPQIECSLCDAKLYTEALLKLHMIKHGEKRFFCSYCNQGFKQKPTLTKHLLKKHGHSK